MQLAHEGSALEGPVFDFGHLVVAQIAGRGGGGRMTELRTPDPLPTPNPCAQEPCPPTPWELPDTQNLPAPSQASVLTAPFPPTGNSHFLQMGELFKHASGLQDGDLIVV